ncbi:hypothetical protein COU56_03425 [Candidatus Pacearchaeota archaeon CG10_big_fil_rev_8_21_14_0_10_31_9]|nr:MAG: hypothetical protein AUJ62_01565 [Candidatus Pacearchaeota archaeon CG1_02_32_21]PIN93668.1 MAG: hypothetical protein COU56_03425 [Candidatus Pacearchaeota archaeon CG10_big_fil_rev_8_21_14_0_10_31_9]PIZ83165.1 MAG: hypothetical protein COX97_01540 [Candidatus Pacearchaeota archaeon CG_4_10_14_0_2_um_filter_05_32_18]
MKIADLKEVKFYDTILELTRIVLGDLDVSLRPLESELAFGVIFNLLEDPKTKGKKESLTVNPYRREILIFYKGQESVAKNLKEFYKFHTGIEFKVIQ